MKRISGLYILDVYLIIVILISGFAITSGTNLLSDGYTGTQPLWMKILSLIIFISALVPLFMVNSKVLFYKPSIFKIVLLSIIFIVTIVNLFLLKNDYTYVVTKNDHTYEFIYHTEPFNYFWYPTKMLVALIIAFLIMDFMPKIMPGNRFIYMMCIVMLCIGTGAIIYSVLIEKDIYMFFLKDFDATQIYKYATRSFFANKNSYGIVLFSCIAVCLYMQLRKDRLYWYIPAFIFYVFLIFSVCKTGIIFATVLIAMDIISRIAITYNKHVIRNTVYVSLLVSTAVVLTVFYFTNESVNRAFKDVFKLFMDNKTFTGRITVWSLAIDVISKNNFITGVGVGFFNEIMTHFNTNPYIIPVPDLVESSYIEMLGEGGIIMLLIFFIFLALIVINASKLFKKNKHVAMFSLVFLITMLGYSVFEGGNIIIPFTPEYGMLAMLVASPLYFRNL